MSKGNLKHNIWSEGGRTGGIVSDASTATAGGPIVLTGISATWIEINSATTFTALSGWDYTTATAYTYYGVNVPTGVAVVAGTELGAGYGREITAISHYGGQIAYYDKVDD